MAHTTKPPQIAVAAGETLPEALVGYLPAFVLGRRWFRSKAAGVRTVTLTDVAALEETSLPREADVRSVFLACLAVERGDGVTDHYFLPLASVDPARVPEAARAHVIAEVSEGGAARLVVDALALPEVVRVLPALFETGARLRGRRITFEFKKTTAWEGASHRGTLDPPRLVATEQSNSSVLFGDRSVLKFFRQLSAGTSPDLEMGAFLTDAGYAHAPSVLGSISVVGLFNQPATVGILHAFVPNQGDAWTYVLGELKKALDATGVARAESATRRDDFGPMLDHAALLGLRVAEMHKALASRGDRPAFAPEAMSRADFRALAEKVAASAERAFELLGERSRTKGALDAASGSLASEILDGKDALLVAIDRFAKRPSEAQRTRVHGDLHLGQILFTGDDFFLIDFEGEPARPLEERRQKQSPLVDVAGMLRSFHYAAVTVGRTVRAVDLAKQEQATTWHRAVSDAFLARYLEAMSNTRILPGDAREVRRLLDFYLLEKCLYELEYEMQNRPDWLAIPLAGLAPIVAAAFAASHSAGAIPAARPGGDS